MKKVIALVGPIASGKTTLGREIQEWFGGIHIEASSIIKKLVEEQKGHQVVDRNDLNGTVELGTELAKRLNVIIEQHPNETIVVTGIRQKFVLDQVKFDKVVYLWTGQDNRFSRYLLRNDKKDNLENGTQYDNWLKFQQAEKQDNELGLEEIYLHYFAGLNETEDLYADLMNDSFITPKYILYFSYNIFQNLKPQLKNN